MHLDLSREVGAGHYSAHEWWTMTLLYMGVTGFFGLTVIVASVSSGFLVWMLPLGAFALESVMGARILLALRDEVLHPNSEESECYDDDDEGAGVVRALTPYEMQATLNSQLDEHPEWSVILEAAIAWEEAHPAAAQHEGKQWGWEWHDVRARTHDLNQMFLAGLLDVTIKTNSGTNYALASLDETREALGMIRDIRSAPSLKEPPSVNLDELFRVVVGHDRAKTVLLGAIQADQPIHVLLYGPPGSAKTLLLSDVAKLPRAEMYGSTTTKSGLVSLLIQKQPPVLILDELDKMASSDMTPLLSLMAQGAVTRLQHKRQERVEFRCKVFATANDLTRVPAPILSRFAKVEIPAYSEADFMLVAQAVLVQKYGFGAEVAKHIAYEVAKCSLDVRDAERIAVLSKGKIAQVAGYVAALFPQARVRAVTPVKR